MFTRRQSEASQREVRLPSYTPATICGLHTVLIDERPPQDRLPQTQKGRAATDCCDAGPAPHPWLIFNPVSLREAQQNSLQVEDHDAWAKWGCATTIYNEKLSGKLSWFLAMFFEPLNKSRDNLVFCEEKGSQTYGSSNICSQEWCYVKTLRKKHSGH